MRVSKDKNDSAYDARERKIFLNDKEVSGEWLSADEFRRVITMADGRNLFGSVYVERLPEVEKQNDKPQEIASENDNKAEPSFVEPENKAEEAEKVPTIAETPKSGYSMRDRVKVKGKGNK